MILPYVYILTHKVTGQFYIGYRVANKKPADVDLPKYQSSSKYIKKIGFDNFHWSIVAEFYDRDAAYDLEQELIRDHIANPLCLNMHHISKTGGVKFRHPGRISDEGREKLSKLNKGKKLSDELRAKMSASQRLRTDRQTMRRLRGVDHPNFGKCGEKSAAFGTKWMFNPSTLEGKKVPANECGTLIIDGWSYGRPPLKKRK